MCDWGGGPNEIQNGGYNKDWRDKPKPRTIKCLKYMPDKPYSAKDGATCGMLIEGFIGSLVYWEEDLAAKKHLEEYH